MEQGKARKCLKCGKRFISRGFGNRICWRCNRDNEKERVKEVQTPKFGPREPQQ